jgi:ferredoxin
MKVVVDQDTCTGCELCCDTAPDIFEMDGDVAKVKVDEVPSDLEDAAQEAADNCPVECIHVS